MVRPMKFKKLKWGQKGPMLQDEYSETVCGKRYQIGTRYGRPEINLWGNSVYATRHNTVEEAKECAQKDFESWITKTFFEEGSCPN